MTGLDDRVHAIAGVEWMSGVSGFREGYPPFVTLRVTSNDGHTIVGQMDIDQARDIIHNGLSSIEAADMDSAVFRFFVSDLHMEPEAAGQIVARLRNHRESMK